MVVSEAELPTGGGGRFAGLVLRLLSAVVLGPLLLAGSLSITSYVLSASRGADSARP